MTTPQSTPPSDRPTDAELITASRTGDSDAYAQLCSRHAGAAMRLARQLTGDAAQRVSTVTQGFTRVLAILRGGGGPDVAFRPYLLRALRDPTEGSAQSLSARAFSRLPERLQLTLWHIDVEGEPAAVVSAMLGLAPDEVPAVALRARERLRQAYVQEHVEATSAAECHWAAQRLGAHVGGGLSDPERLAVEEHLQGCPDCQELFGALEQVTTGLRGILATVVLGGLAEGYLAGRARFGPAAGLGRLLAPWDGAQASFGTAAAAAGVAASVAVLTAVAVAGVTLASHGAPGGAAATRHGSAAAQLRPGAGGPRSGPRSPAPRANAPSTGESGRSGRPDFTRPAVSPSAATTGSATPQPQPPPPPRTPPPLPSPQPSPAGPYADLGLTLSATPVVGAQALLSARVTNAGPDRTGPVSLSITLPDGMLAALGTISGDWTCSGTKTVSCSHRPLAAGEWTDVTVPLLVSPVAAGGVVSAECSSTTTDPDLLDNSATVPVGVAAKLLPGRSG